MKKIKLVFLSALILGLFVTSCDKEKEENITNVSKIQPTKIEGNDLRQQVIASNFPISQLTNTELLDVSISKINQLLTNDLPHVEEGLLETLKSELTKHYNNEPNEVITIGTQLANIIPEEDFILMFFYLEDYVFNGSYIGVNSVSQEIINEIGGLRYTGDPIGSGFGGEPTLGICDCGLTCGSPSTMCTPTERGCGWCWAYPCTKTDYPLIPK